MTRSILIALLRSDLRLHDHAIFSACRPGSSALPNVTHVVPVYVFDQKYVEVGGITGLTKGKGPGHNGAKTRVAGFWRCGPHRTRFVTRSVYDLKARLKKLGSDLSIWAGQPDVVLAKLVEAFQRGGDKVEAVWMSGEPHTEEVNTEKRIKKALAPSQTPLKLVENSSLIDPKDLPFDIKDLPDVFTHFRKRVEAPDMFKPPESAPDKLLPFVEVPKVDNGPGVFKVGDDVSEESLIAQLLAPLDEEPGPLPVLGQLKGQELPNALPFKGGETEALARLDHYFGGGKQAPAATYKDTRNEMLGADYSTKFSSALAHGLLSARTIAHRATQLDKSNGAKGRDGGGYWIIFELLWRDYFRLVSLKYGSSLYTIYGIEGELDEKTSDQKAREWIQPRSFDDKSDAFVRWATFETGVPLIDANMKELAATGFMSNRGRQNVASLLTKDLYYDWRLGAEWFEHLLVDYDPASNYGNWQYVAGVGNDPRASRQFNPIKQAKDYDQQAKYVKAWLPVLEGLPHAEAHHPWTRAEGSPEGYPSKPVVENNMWKSHYARDGSSRGGIRGGGGGGGRGGGRGRGRGGRGRGRGRGSGDRSRNRGETHDQ